MTYPEFRGQALAEVAGVLAASDPQRALRMVSEAEQAATNGSLFSRALVLVSVVKVAAGLDPEAADQMAQQIDDQTAQEEALIAVARAFAGSNLVRAEQIARSITRPDGRAQALSEVADEVGLPAANHLLAPAFALGSWLPPLWAMAKHHPQEADRIARTLYPDDRR
ncbi:hypothetical protein [Kitasatospora sp. LaBMicrA B282]|uniref:hypothetical protein n=1 Tax=Kitasatospora sp. LaBMicrA B282 TaxID=3420949 RepID=UPI003D0A2522